MNKEALYPYHSTYHTKMVCFGVLSLNKQSEDCVIWMAKPVFLDVITLEALLDFTTFDKLQKVKRRLQILLLRPSVN